MWAHLYPAPCSGRLSPSLTQAEALSTRGPVRAVPSARTIRLSQGGLWTFPKRNFPPLMLPLHVACVFHYIYSSLQLLCYVSPPLEDRVGDCLVQHSTHMAGAQKIVLECFCSGQLGIRVFTCLLAP